MSERQQQQKFVLPLEKYGTYRNEVLESRKSKITAQRGSLSEDNDEGISPQGRQKGWSTFRGHFGKSTRRYQRGGYELQTSHPHKDDGNGEMRGVQKYQARHTPYTLGHNKRRVQWHNKGHLCVTVWTNRKHVKREMGENTQDRTLESWFKITVPCARKYDRTWLMDSIQSHCSVPFIPVEFHYAQNRARFFVQDASAASALKDVSYKICDEENQKIAIFVSTSAVPYSVQDKLKPEEMEQLKLTMNKRYDVSHKALDLHKLRFDPGFAHLDIDIILNRRSCMAATLQIIEKNFPELLSLNLYNNRLYQLDGLSDIIQMAPTVKILNLSKNELKSTWELGKIKGLKLEELWLKDNPLCRNFPDQSTYIRAIRKCFPKLLRLDGQDLPPPTTVDIDRPYINKPLKESCKGSDVLKTQVLQFLQQYYLIYDSGDRQHLLGAYHDEACFSLTIPFSWDDPATSSLFEYFKDNRNMKNLKDPNLCFQLLKHTKHDIVSSLCVLPKTQHDLSSFLVDMFFQSESLLFFCVSGVFREVKSTPLGMSTNSHPDWGTLHDCVKHGSKGLLFVVVDMEESSQGSVRAFTRTFIATPAGNSSLCVVNEELFVRDVTPTKTQSGLTTQVPSPSSSTGPTLSQEQEEVVQVSSILSGMSL